MWNDLHQIKSDMAQAIVELRQLVDEQAAATSIGQRHQIHERSVVLFEQRIQPLSRLYHDRLQQADLDLDQTRREYETFHRQHEEIIELLNRMRAYEHGANEHGDKPNTP